MTQDAFARCPECDEYLFGAEHCQNPACRPGLKAHQQAMKEWTERRDAFVAERTKGMYIQPAAFREYFERDNPKPVLS